MEKIEELTVELKKLLAARRELNTEIKKVRNKIKGQLTKETFSRLADLLDIDEEFFENM